MGKAISGRDGAQAEVTRIAIYISCSDVAERGGGTKITAELDLTGRFARTYAPRNLRRPIRPTIARANPQTAVPGSGTGAIEMVSVARKFGPMAGVPTFIRSYPGREKTGVNSMSELP